MVLVERPRSASPQGHDIATPVAKETIPESSFDDAASLFDYEDASPSKVESQSEDSAANSTPDDSETEPEAVLAPLAAAAVLPNASWSSSATLPMKQYLLTGVAGFVGVAIAFGAIAYIVSRGDGMPPQVNAAGNVEANEGPAKTDGPLTSQTDSSATTTGSNQDVDEQPVTDSVVDDETPSSVQQPKALEPEPQPPIPGATNALVPSTEAAKQIDEPTPDVEPDGPPDLLVSESFLVDQPPASAIADEQQGAEPQRPTPSSDENMVAGRPEPKPRDVDAATQLAVRLPAIEFSDTSLADFLAVMSRLSTVPITVDLDSLAWARVGLQTPVSLKQNDVSIEEILNAALTPIHLTAVVEAHDVLITVKSRNDALREHRFPVGDLVSSDQADRQAFTSLIQSVVLPHTWASRGGNATISLQEDRLVISQTDQGLLDSLLFLEQLRIARGLPQKTRYPHELLQVESPTLLAIDKLEQLLSLNFSQPTPLPRILKRLGEETDLRIVVDWRMAGQMGWSPSTETTLVVEEKSFQGSLSALLRPLKLSFLVINARTIQVTSAEKVTRRQRLEMYPLPSSINISAKDLATQLRNSRELSANAQANIHFDHASEHLIAWLTQAEHLALANLIAGLRP